MHVVFARDDLRPLICEVVAEMLDRFGAADRIALTEEEAGTAIGVKGHVIRDARLRGEISGAKVGRGYCYTRQDLVAFLERRKAQEAMS